MTMIWRGQTSTPSARKSRSTSPTWTCLRSSTHLAADLAVIDELIASMDKVAPDDDAKLQQLSALITAKVRRPINSGNRKVLVFTAFADTANYLYKNIAGLAGQLGLNAGRVTGSDAPKTTLGKPYDFQGVLTLFSPRSKEKAVVMPNERGELDILVGTDCISEGQNLQDCDFLINYDIHWNPVRIIQRFGRHRPHRLAQRADSARQLSARHHPRRDINLKERVENRMVIADVTATGDDNVLTAKSSDIAYRKEQLKRLQEEVIELEDVKAGISITDLGLNDFRMDLLNHVKEHGELDDIPLGLHAVVPAQPDPGAPAGRDLRPPQYPPVREHQPAEPTAPVLSPSTSVRMARSSPITPR